ncbi:MAG: NAD-dependent DNA ligase LigA, partial [Dehalococcoidales bacterium]|nr:NAD-dependent DNA ligase LigA [Dehalococcoidales bacterium]
LADSITAFFKQQENLDIIARLDKADVISEEKPANSEKLHLVGQEFVVTGRLEGFTRQEAESKIRELGGKATSNVTRKTTYVVVGIDPGSKLARAESLGITQLNELEFLRLLEPIQNK